LCAQLGQLLERASRNFEAQAERPALEHDGIATALNQFTFEERQHSPLGLTLSTIHPFQATTGTP
jgi:hypothetical protein